MLVQLSRFSVKIQIAVIGVCAVAGVVAIGGIYANGQASMAPFKASQVDAYELRKLATGMNVELLEMRRAEKDFFLRQDERYAERHGKSATTLAADIPKFAEPLGRVPELASLRPKIEAVRTGFEEYRKHFLQAADLQRKLGLTEATGLEGTLRSSVRAVESKLAGTSEGQLTIAMLMMRRHEKDFMLRDDPRYVTDMADRAKEFAKLLEASSIKGAPLEDVRTGMAAYQRDFGAFAVAKSSLKAEMKALSDAYARIDPVVDEIVAAVEKQYQAATRARPAGGRCRDEPRPLDRAWPHAGDRWSSRTPYRTCHLEAPHRACRHHGPSLQRQPRCERGRGRAW
jgi:methyl-accepting chemotaxis protein